MPATLGLSDERACRTARGDGAVVHWRGVPEPRPTDQHRLALIGMIAADVAAINLLPGRIGIIIVSFKYYLRI